MPTATLHPATTTPGLDVTPVQPKTPLRRAVYVHVSDLLSAYNIDHSKLEEELRRVKVNRVQASTRTTPESSNLGVPTELDTSSNQKKLQPPRGGFNLCVLVGEVDLVVDKHRVDGSRVRLAEVEVGDETGRVSLRARDEQIDLLQQVSDQKGAVVLRNSTLELFQGKHIRLAVTKWGKITPYPDHIASTPVPPSKMNEDRFFSSIDLSVVALDGSVHSQNEGYSLQSGDTADTSTYGNTNPGHNQRGGRPVGRKPSRPKASIQPYPGAIPVGYSDNNMMRYQGGLHGYGYVENMDGYGYRQRQPETMASAHMMLQQQYEMHQRQIHQMYHGGGRPPHDQQNMGGSASMIPTGIHPAGSFDGSFTGQQRGDVFLPHGMPSGAPNVVYPTPSHSTPTPERRQASSTSFPASPKMNPRAAKFDPNGPSLPGAGK